METPKDHDPYEALREPGYLPYIAGGVISSVGVEIQAVAVGWELYERTDSAQMLGFTGLAQFLPVLLFALPAGQAADHFNRRKMFQSAQAVSAIASLLLAWLSWEQGPIWLVFACLTLSGTGRAFTAPARASLLSQLVPMNILPNAVAWNSTGWQLANVSGPALGGIVVATAKGLSLEHVYAVPYLLAAGCSLCCVGLLFTVYPKRPPSLGVPRTVANLLAGLHFVRQSPLLLAAISLDLFAVLLGGATALLPVYAKDILYVDAIGFGLLRACAGAGRTADGDRHGASAAVATTGLGAAARRGWLWTRRRSSSASRRRCRCRSRCSS